MSRLSGRRTVRVDVRDAHGDWAHSYETSHALTAACPEGPWALPLTDPAGWYRFLAFDLDAKAGNAIHDAQRLTRWLDELAIAYVVCESGPAGGRHVWIALTAAADPAIVAQLARRARTVLPSLDITPLSNARTGAVRPPLAPHRHGGRSRPLGPVDVLTAPTTTPEQLQALDTWLDEEGVELPPLPHATRPRGVDVDEHGHPHLVGDRRELSPRACAMVAAAPAADTSATMAQVFLAAANARWRYDDVVRLARSAPALEHARTRSGPGGRVPRTEPGFQHAVQSAWIMAVDYAATHPTDRVGDDPSFPAREILVVQALTRVQERANARPGQWGADRGSRAQRAVHGSPAHRAVLDALCLFMGQAVSLEVEADSRRLALETGWGRTTVQTALRALQDAGWIRRTADAIGEHGARYTLSEAFSTEEHVHDWSQGRKPPGREPLLRELTQQLRPLRHDAFAAPLSLGRSSGLVYQRLSSGGSWTVPELVVHTGIPAHRVRRFVHRLVRHRLVRLVDGRWEADPGGDVDQVAQLLDVAGYLDDRRRRYEVERIVWARWQQELHQMRQDHVAKRRPRPHPTAVQLTGQAIHERSRYPRGPDKRADHKTARLIEAARLNREALVAVLEAELSGRPVTPP